MKISQSIILGALAVVFVFLKPAESRIPTFLTLVAEDEQIFVGQKFQEIQETNIMTREDSLSLTTKDVIEDIRSEARKLPADKINPLAVNASIGGVLEAIRMAYYCAMEDNKAIEAAIGLVREQKLKEALDIIKSRFSRDREIIYMAGIPAQIDQGIALTLVGDVAMPNLRKSIFSIQNAGDSILEVFRLCEEMSKAGIKNGGDAAEAALNSVKHVSETGFLTVLEKLRDAAKISLEGLLVASSKTNKNVDMTIEIIQSLKTDLVTDNTNALAVVGKLTSGLNSLSNGSTSKRVIDSASGIYEGLKSTIHEIGYAIDTVKETLREAENLAKQNPEAAVDIVRKGIKTAIEKVQNGAGYAFLAFGFAGHTMGKTVADKFVIDVLEMELGTATSYQDLELAEKLAVISIRIGKSALKQGITTALEMFDASALSLFQDYLEAGWNAFELLRKLSTE